MREVEVSRFVPASPPVVERTVSPADVIEYEGTYEVDEVTETDEGIRVAAGAGGVGAVFLFREAENGYEYVQAAGPLEYLSTTLTWEPEPDGTTVTLRSEVSFGYPPAAITDRVAAWKRRGELRRALDAIADAVE